MYGFPYDWIQNQCGNKSRLLFTSADSWIYEIETENAHDDFSKSGEMFDFSDYSAESKYYDESSALVVGKMKDGMGGVSIVKFVGLKPKMYFILMSDSD